VGVCGSEQVSVWVLSCWLGSITTRRQHKESIKQYSFFSADSSTKSGEMYMPMIESNRIHSSLETYVKIYRINTIVEWFCFDFFF